MRLRMKLVMVKWKETLGNGIKRIEIFFSFLSKYIFLCDRNKYNNGILIAPEPLTKEALGK